MKNKYSFDVLLFFWFVEIAYIFLFSLLKRIAPYVK